MGKGHLWCAKLLHLWHFLGGLESPLESPEAEAARPGSLPSFWTFPLAAAIFRGVAPSKFCFSCQIGLKSDPKIWIKCCKGLSHRPYEPLLRAVVLESLGGCNLQNPWRQSWSWIHDSQQAKHENPQNCLHEMYRNYSWIDPLVMTNSSPWYRWPIEIDGLPMVYLLKMVDLSMANC